MNSGDSDNSEIIDDSKDNDDMDTTQETFMENEEEEDFTNFDEKTEVEENYNETEDNNNDEMPEEEIENEENEEMDPNLRKVLNNIIRITRERFGFIKTEKEPIKVQKRTNLFIGRQMPAISINSSFFQLFVLGVFNLPIDLMLFKKFAIRVSIWDKDTNSLLKKENPDSNVVYHDGEGEYVPPVMTRVYEYDPKENGANLLFTDRIIFHFTYETVLRPEICFLFEVLTPSSPQFYRGESIKDKISSQGWILHCFSFFQPVALYNTITRSNTEERVDLSVFHPNKKSLNFDWNVMNGTTLVNLTNVKDFKPIKEMKMSIKMSGCKRPSVMKVKYPQRPIFLHQLEGQFSDEESEDEIERRIPLEGWESELWKMRRFVSSCIHWCDILTVEPAFILPATKNGCNILRFSPCGRYLAAAYIDENEKSGVLIYELPKFKLIKNIMQSALVHDLCWYCTDVRNDILKDENYTTYQKAPKSLYLATATSDGNVNVFTTEDWNLMFLLSHGFYVYSILILNIEFDIYLFTAGFEGIIRIFRIPKDIQGINLQENNFSQMLASETKPQGIIVSLKYSKEKNIIYAGLEESSILEYTIEIKTSAMDFDHSKFIYLIFKKEIADEKINARLVAMDIQPPFGQHIAMYTNDNLIHPYQTTWNFFGQKFSGALCSTSILPVIYSPDGERLLAGSEDGKLLIWNADDQLPLTTHWSPYFSDPLCCLDYHPFQNMVALGAYGKNQPIIILKNSDEQSKLLSDEKYQQRMIQELRALQEQLNSINI
eukprot:TRINITY_DN931_c0_g1_i1.p1 TRINITY_DN931_c0_g1~~TRINITY_DN931_c0_g1_i1.p1  ORF type:complete len:772 (+),score=171.09 TRINITY_DN931_c0_g1_i1:44-2359(+)